MGNAVQDDSLPVGSPCYGCGKLESGEYQGRRREQPFNPAARLTAKEEILSRAKELTEISLYLHDNPELKWEEVKAHRKITDYLSAQGFNVEPIDGMPTAFRVAYTHGTGGQTFGLNSEYDALENIGHACGHNLIAISGIAALLGMRAAMQKHGIQGKVVLLGTPAEEGGVGKQLLLEKGAYSDMDACMMLHPAPGPVQRGDIGPSYASIGVKIEYFGKASHAAMAPWDGVSALEAAILAHNSIAAIRQQFEPHVRVHGVITQGGGIGSNIIPAYSEMTYSVRGSTTADLERTWTKVEACFKNAATVTGCTVKIERGLVHDDLRNNPSICEEYSSTMGEMFDIPVRYGFTQNSNWGASTDFGNVTYHMPACHPMIGMPNPPGRPLHTPEFATTVRTDEAHSELFKAATAMAVVGLRFLEDDEYAKETVASWKADMARG